MPTGSVDLRNVLFLENRSVNLERAPAGTRVELRGQTVLIRVGERNDEETVFVIDVAERISEEPDLPDIYLKLAMYDDRLAIYWRETFLHRIYRQGLMSIQNNDLVSLCEGRGGVEVSH